MLVPMTILPGCMIFWPEWSIVSLGFLIDTKVLAELRKGARANPGVHDPVRRNRSKET